MDKDALTVAPSLSSVKFPCWRDIEFVWLLVPGGRPLFPRNFPVAPECFESSLPPLRNTMYACVKPASYGLSRFLEKSTKFPSIVAPSRTFNFNIFFMLKIIYEEIIDRDIDIKIVRIFFFIFFSLFQYLSFHLS